MTNSTWHEKRGFIFSGMNMRFQTLVRLILTEARGNTIGYSWL